MWSQQYCMPALLLIAVRPGYPQLLLLLLIAVCWLPTPVTPVLFTTFSSLILRILQPGVFLLPLPAAHNWIYSSPQCTVVNVSPCLRGGGTSLSTVVTTGEWGRVVFSLLWSQPCSEKGKCIILSTVIPTSEKRKCIIPSTVDTTSE